MLSHRYARSRDAARVVAGSSETGAGVLCRSGWQAVVYL
jgi:hypothetical protein